MAFPASFVDLLIEYIYAFGEPTTHPEILELRAILYRNPDPLATLNRIIHVLATHSYNREDMDILCRVLARIMENEPNVNVPLLYANTKRMLAHVG